MNVLVQCTTWAAFDMKLPPAQELSKCNRTSYFNDRRNFWLIIFSNQLNILNFVKCTSLNLLNMNLILPTRNKILPNERFFC